MGSFRLIQSVLSLFSKYFWCLCTETQYTPRKIPTSSSFVSKMILNKVALLVMVLVQVTFILGSEEATSAATDAPEETTEKPSLSKKCCELQGVPKDCMYACQEQSNVTSRNDVPCMDHIHKIQECLEEPNSGFKKDLVACCDYYNVKEEAICHNLLCTSKCPSTLDADADPNTLPWAFLELYPKKECNKYVEEIKKCCGYHETN